jgi:SAM-dependent methyltransferase
MIPLGVSYRRVLLDAELARLAPAIRGAVLEVGAAAARRGRFVPPTAGVSRWLKVDLDPTRRPHAAGDVEALPVRTESMDWVLCIEVLEYVPSPERAVTEITRVLAPGGTAVLAAPFLHRADAPADRRRFTAVGLAELATRAGLRVTEVTAQGRFFTTLANMGRQAVAHIATRPLRWAAAAAVAPLAAFLLRVDGWPAVARSPFLSSFSTGFIVVGRRR